MPTTDDLAQAIATMEGYFKTGTRAQRNNNPGNLRAGPRAISKDDAGLAVYATAADGWADLYRQIDLDAGRGLSLSQFIGKYAPPNENNTSGYLSFVSSAIGAAPATLLAELGAGTPENPPKAPLRRAGRAGEPKKTTPATSRA